MTLRHYEPVAADCPECLAALECEGRGPVVITTIPVAATARDTLPAGERRFRDGGVGAERP